MIAKHLGGKSKTGDTIHAPGRLINPAISVAARLAKNYELMPLKESFTFVCTALKAPGY